MRQALPVKATEHDDVGHRCHKLRQVDASACTDISQLQIVLPAIALYHCVQFRPTDSTLARSRSEGQDELPVTLVVAATDSSGLFHGSVTVIAPLRRRVRQQDDTGSCHTCSALSASSCKRLSPIFPELEAVQRRSERRPGPACARSQLGGAELTGLRRLQGAEAPLSGLIAMLAAMDILANATRPDRR